MKPVYVITPTIGSQYLVDCVKSVVAQSHENVIHVLVVDGQVYEGEVRSIVSEFGNERTQIITVPWNTGGGGYLGHIIYAAISRLVMEGYVAFLDEDNYYDVNHVQSCIALIEQFDLSWCYALRRIVDSFGRFVCDDNCDSLGIWTGFDGCYNQIDTNCYMFGLHALMRNVDVLRRLEHVKGETSGDRMLAHSLLNGYDRYFVTGKYSVNYRVKARTGVSEEDVLGWFRTGNEIQSQVYKVFPWANFECRQEGGYISSMGYCRSSIGKAIPALVDVWERNYDR